MTEQDEKLYALAKCGAYVDAALTLAREARSYLPVDLEGSVLEGKIRDAVDRLIDAAQGVAVMLSKR